MHVFSNHHKMDIENVNYSLRDLERRTYRYLQKLAKSLYLPSNVKKMYLIQLIHAKKFKTEHEVNTMVEEVKAERKQAQNKKRNRKRHLQNREISSTSCQSPPITYTPKRSVHPVLRYSPDFTHTYLKSNRQSFLPNTTITARSVAGSDRVLRSFNLKALRKSYGAANVNNPITSAIRVQNQATSPKEKIRIVSSMGRLTKFDMAGRCLERRRSGLLSRNPYVALRNENPRQYIVAEDTHQPKRQRTLSGIYPLIPPEIPYQKFDQIQGVRLRRTDGKLSTINALIQKRNISDIFKPPLPKRSTEISIQDILNSLDNNPEPPNYIPPNLNTHIDLVANRSYNFPGSESHKENDSSDGYSVYYHKKIRSEQLKYRRMSCRESEVDKLPRIADVFSQFNRVPSRNVMQPLYVQVNNEPERVPSYPLYTSRNIANSHMLESVYNFRNSLLTNAPFLQLAATAKTECVYTTSLIATATVQQSVPLVPTEPFNPAPCEPDNQYRCSHDLQLPLFAQDAFRYGYADDMSNAVSSQPLADARAAIPDMVEDALEIISQDGDYMEQIGMDIRVQCVLCSWAGPKIILEYHIRKEHASQIHEQSRSEWSVVFTLGALCAGPARAWRSQVVARGAALCALSARCDERHALHATLSSLSPEPMESRGSITIYNKVTGEPFSWEGSVQPFPPNLPYENDLPGLRVELSKLDLLPNSANLKLLNKELVLMSPTKVVVGQPQLNDIHIMLFVRIS